MKYFSSLTHERPLSRAFIVLLLLVNPFAFRSHGQQKQSSTPNPVDWKALTPGIEAALESEFKFCNQDRRSIDVVQTADVTGDGVPEALVNYCHMGAYTSDLALIQLIGGKPVSAHFQGKDGKVVTPGFLEGASVRNGEATKLLAEKHAVYAIHWNTDNSGKLAACIVDAYVWAAKSGTFNANGAISKEIAKSACPQLRQELNGEPNPPQRR
jgi:hypothetical protein